LYNILIQNGYEGGIKLSKSRIEWTERTWNPVTGCTKISEGCKNCYAERMAERIQSMGNERYRNGFQLTIQHDLLEKPLEWKKPSIIFVNSMSDLFHKDVPLEYIKKVFEVMNKAHWHTFQILTKRSERLVELAPHLEWGKNIWMGVSVENERVTNRIDHLKNVPAHIRFLSCEPLLGELGDIDLTEIHWVIAGGESGPRSRPIEESWVISIRNQCKKYNTAFFFKQWGGTNKKSTGRLLEGRTWDEFPNTSN